MGSDDCIFCAIAGGSIPCVEVYSDDSVIAFLDIGPVSDGHTLVIPRGHYGKMDECPAEVLGAVSSCIGEIAEAVVSAVGAEAYNVLCNNGRAAGQIVGHVHWHIIPRNTGDGVFDCWPAYKYEDGKAAKIAEKIREKL